MAHNDGCEESQLLLTANVKSTMFTKWMEKNNDCKDTRSLTYSEFGQHYWWDSSKQMWNLREKEEPKARMKLIHPNAGEMFYLRTLLHVVKGPKCLKDILTVDGVTHEKFRDACYAMGLLDDEKEWHDALLEAAKWNTTQQKITRSSWKQVQQFSGDEKISKNCDMGIGAKEQAAGSGDVNLKLTGYSSNEDYKHLVEVTEESEIKTSESSKTAAIEKLTRLFVTIMMNCEVNDPFSLLKTLCKCIGDLTSDQQPHPPTEGIHLTNEDELQQTILIQIENLLQEHGKTLKDFKGMPLPKI